MEEKVLGKITEVEYGKYADRGFLFGLDLTFKLGNGGFVGTGGKYTLNISEECKGWESEEEKNKLFMEQLNHLNKILTDTKVNSVSELKDKPVEVTLRDRTFKDFRILTEVL